MIRGRDVEKKETRKGGLGITLDEGGKLESKV